MLSWDYSFWGAERKEKPETEFQRFDEILGQDHEQKLMDQCERHFLEWWVLCLWSKVYLGRSPFSCQFLLEASHTLAFWKPATLAWAPVSQWAPMLWPPFSNDFSSCTQLEQLDTGARERSVCAYRLICETHTFGSHQKSFIIVHFISFIWNSPILLSCT